METLQSIKYKVQIYFINNEINADIGNYSSAYINGDLSFEFYPDSVKNKLNYKNL